jgi:PKD repeat protein
VDSLSVNIATAYHWDFGDGNSSMLATPTHAYTKDSVYNICLKIFTASNDSCSYCHIIGIDAAGNIYRTSGFNVIVINKNLQTGVKSIESNENSFTVFPNPTNGLINIQSSNPKGSIIQIKITDVLGNNIYSSTLQGGGQIDLSSQANGVYFISIQTNEGTVNKKIIITQ